MPIWRLHTIRFQLYDILKKNPQTIAMLKGSELTKALRGDGWIGRSTGFFEVMNCALWYYNYGSKSLYICPNQYNVHHQEWTLRRKWWLWYVYVGSPAIIMYHSGSRYTSNVIHLWGRVYMGEFLYLPVNFAVNLKLL